ncbi:MAG: hypothetical protein K6T28_02865 [Acidothermus sp.]|nr:hypothetical protein [Acidothermus sp.]
MSELMLWGIGRGRRSAHHWRVNRDNGYVTAEAAIVFPMVVFVGILALWILMAGLGQIRTVDAARTAARALARGEAQTEVLAAARAAAPQGAAIQIHRFSTPVGEMVQVVVRARVGSVGRLPFPTPEVASTAVARLEP